MHTNPAPPERPHKSFFNLHKLLHWPLTDFLGDKRPLIAYLHDLIMAGIAFVMALYLRVGDDMFLRYQDALTYGTPIFVITAGVSFRALDIYRGIWRYASLADMFALVRAVSLTILLFVPCMYLVAHIGVLPRAVPPMSWFILLVLMAGPRLIYRTARDKGFAWFHDSPETHHRIPVLLLGLGDEGIGFLRIVTRDSAAPYRVTGVLDDDRALLGRDVYGVTVLGGIESLADILAHASRNLSGRDNTMPQRLIIGASRNRIDGPALRKIIDIAESHGIAVARLPASTDFHAATASTEIKFRPIDVEDLLGRPQVSLNKDAINRLIASRRVLVTGAGGSIGSELARQIAAHQPSHLELVENNEFALYKIGMELQENFPDLPIHSHFADVRDSARIRALLQSLQPDTVFHAAAMKHVPIVETSPAEGILTNAIGTRNVAEAALACNATAMVLISTDKAVQPSSAMGASKRLAESYIQALDLTQTGSTRFLTVRFGNVLGSTGSVVPLFQHQLAQGGPLTVTHPDIERYFMTIREAVQLVLQAAAFGLEHTAERGRIMVLDMGEPVKIVDLARQMIRLAGLRPDIDIQIRYTGLRPGEKLREELFDSSEHLQPSGAEGILLAAARPSDLALARRAFDELEHAAHSGDTTRIIALLCRLIPDYTPDASHSFNHKQDISA